MTISRTRPTFSNFLATLHEAQKLINKYVRTKSSAPQARAQTPPLDNKIIANDGLTFFNQDDSPNTKRGKCKRCGSNNHWQGPKCPDHNKDRYLVEKCHKLEYEATQKLKSGAQIVDRTAPDSGNIHATIGIEDDNFSDEDNYGLAFLNLAADGALKVPSKIDSTNYDTVFKQSGGKVNSTWVLLDNQSTVIF